VVSGSPSENTMEIALKEVSSGCNGCWVFPTVGPSVMVQNKLIVPAMNRTLTVRLSGPWPIREQYWHISDFVM
jgi:hypothetical protein